MKWARVFVLGLLPLVSAAPLDPYQFHICTVNGSNGLVLAELAGLPRVTCHPQPTTFTSLPSIGKGGNTSVDLRVGYDPTANTLCYVSTGTTLPPVLRVGVGDQLQVSIANTLHNDFDGRRINCPIQVFGGGAEGTCKVLPHFEEQPGADGTYYPLEANEAHAADGTTNLHVHGLFVAPTACSDEVLNTIVYPANWTAKVAPLQPCQTTADSITYSYALPATHPAGAYWYHTHRHGETEQETQMGLAGAIVVEDAGDAWRQSIGVTDEVLLIDDTPIPACATPPNCSLGAHATVARRIAARAMAHASSSPTLDPRIDQKDQAGECADGAKGSAGGTELWTLTLNGAPVPDSASDGPVLSKVMQPGQRQIFRLVNASADSFVAPNLVLSQNGTTTALPLELMGRDGVGMAKPSGTRILVNQDTTTTPLIVPPAGRVEFVVHAPPTGATLYLQSAQVNPGCGGNAYPARQLLSITSAGTPVDPGAPDDSDLLEHTPSLAPYFATLKQPVTVHRTLVFAEYGRDFTYGVTKWLTGPPNLEDYNFAATDFYIVQTASDDGEVKQARTALRPFLPTSPPAVVVHLHGQSSVTEEWLVENSTLEIHAFHIHQIHFEDVTSPAAADTMQPVLDTITVPNAALIGGIAHGYPGTPGWVRLKMTFTTQDIGEFVFHCHILEHEDNGMMAKIQVVAD